MTCVASEGSYKRAKGHRSLREGDEAEMLVAPINANLIEQRKIFMEKQ